MLPQSRSFEECVAGRASPALSTPQPAQGIPEPVDDVGSVLVLLPTFNEVATITETIRRARAARPDSHILVVDDNSPDGTANTVAAIAETTPNLFLLVRPMKDGLGSALMEGFGFAEARGFDVVVTLDSDLSHDPSQIPALLAAVAAGADVVVGSRYLPESPVPRWSRRRLWLSQTANRYIRCWLRLGVSDSTSGFRAYRVEALRQAKVRSAPARGYCFLIGMLRRLVESGAAVTEVPILFTDRTTGESKMSWRIIVEALLLVFWWGTQSRARNAANRIRSSAVSYAKTTTTDRHALHDQPSTVPLWRAMTTLDLSSSDIAVMMGVGRQTVDMWLLTGPPADRVAKIDALAEVADILSYQLRDGTAPAVVRRRADGYDGRSILEVFADDDHERLLRSVKNSFDYTSSI